MNKKDKFEIQYKRVKAIENIVFETIMETLEGFGVTRGSTLWEAKYIEAKDRFMDKLDKRFIFKGK